MQIKDLKRCKDCDPSIMPSPAEWARHYSDRPPYYWVQCGECPACKVGDCEATPYLAQKAWNKMIDK